MAPSRLRPFLHAIWLVPLVAVPLAYGEGRTRNHGAVKDFAALTAAAVVGVSGLASWRPRRRGEPEIDPTHVYATLFVLFAWSAITVFWHTCRWTAGGPLSTWPILAAGSLGASVLLGSPRVRRVALAGYGLACAVAAVAYLSRTYGPVPFEGPGHHFPFANPNVGAAFLLAPAVAATVLCVHFRLRRHGPGTALSFAVAAACWAGITWSDAKGAWLGGFVGAIGGTALVTRGLARRVVLGLAAAVALAGIVLTAVKPERARDLRTSSEVRAQMLKGTWALVCETPLTFLAGHGTGAFYVEYPRFEPLDAEARPEWASLNDSPHNFVLAVWSGSGIAGVLLLAVFAGTVAAAVRQGLRRRTDPDDRAVLAAAGAALASLFVHGQLDIVLEVPFVAWQAGVALALVAALGSSRPDGPDPEPGEPLPSRILQLVAGVRWSAAACLAALWGTSALGTLESEIADHQADQLQRLAEERENLGDRAASSRAFEESLAAYDEALREAPWDGYRTIGIRVRRAVLLLWFAEAKPSGDLARKAYRSLDEISNRDRGMIRNWGLGDGLLAKAALLSGDVGKAADHLRRGSGRRPAQWRYYEFYVDRHTALPPGLGVDLERNAQRGLAIAPESFPLQASHALLVDVRDPIAAAPLVEEALEKSAELERRLDALRADDRVELRDLIAALRAAHGR